MYRGSNEETRSKYNVDKNVGRRTYEGIVFDSILEMKYYRDVILPKVASGEIKEVELQKEFILQEKFVRNGLSVQPIKYIADFAITYSDGRYEVIDTKGHPDTTATIKKKLFWKIYPDIDYKWMSYSADLGWTTFETLNKHKKMKKRLAKEDKNNG